MDFLSFIQAEIIHFFNLSGLVRVLGEDHPIDLWSQGSLFAVILPLGPGILLLEIAHALTSKKSRLVDFKAPLITYLINIQIIGRLISLGVVGVTISVFAPHALFKSSFNWYWILYGYLVYEFSHFIYHWSCHKVRLLWCLHATHHAPEAMNMSVAYAHFFLEAPYANFMRTAICMILGVDIEVFVLVFYLDMVWGQIIHVGDSVLPNGRLGFLHRIILTPSHHRVHHGRNPLYVDTNYCNLLPVWDRIFHTYQEESDKEPIDYGITRKIDSTSVLAVNFAEIIALVHSLRHAPGLRNKLLYMFMPPGWSHTGEHRTAAQVKRQYAQRKAL